MTERLYWSCSKGDKTKSKLNTNERKRTLCLPFYIRSVFSGLIILLSLTRSPKEKSRQALIWRTRKSSAVLTLQLVTSVELVQEEFLMIRFRMSTYSYTTGCSVQFSLNLSWLGRHPDIFWQFLPQLIKISQERNSASELLILPASLVQTGAVTRSLHQATRTFKSTES